MNELISRFRPISEATFISEATKGKISKELITRRAVAIKNELEILFQNSNSSPEQVAQIAGATINAFRDTVINLNKSLDKEVEELQSELRLYVDERAQKATAKALDSEIEAALDAFDSFLKMENQVLKAERSLNQVESRWKKEANQLEKGGISNTRMIYTIAETDFSGQIPEFVNPKFLEQQKADLVTRLQAIGSRLKNGPSLGQSLEELVPAGLGTKVTQKLKNKAQKSDNLLVQAFAVREYAHKLMNSSTAAISFLQDEDTASVLLDQLSTNLNLLSNAIMQYDPGNKDVVSDLIKKNRGLIDNYHNNINKNHQQDIDILQKLNIADFSATGAGNYHKFLKFKHEFFGAFVEQFEHFQKIENLFEQGHISELSVLDFRSVTPKLFERLREIVSQKLAPLSTKGASPDLIEVARKFKRDLRQFLETAGGEIGKEFTLFNLKRTWGEWFSELLATFLNFLRSFTSSNEEQRNVQPAIYQPIQENLANEAPVSREIAPNLPPQELELSEDDNLDAGSIDNPGEATQAYLDMLNEESDSESEPGFSAAAAYEARAAI